MNSSDNNKFFFNIQIDSLTDDGRGLAHIDGKAVFVKNAIPNDLVDIKITQQHHNFDEAELQQIQQASDLRTEPFCQYYGRCGGCQLQHMKIDSQLHYKNLNLQQQLKKSLDCKRTQFLDPLHNQDRAYRRRARLGLAVSRVDKKARLGFRQADSNELIDIEQCPVLSNKLNQSLAENRKTWLQQASRSYREITLVEADNDTYWQIDKPQPEQVSQSDNSETAYYRLNGSSNELTIEFPPQGFVQVNPSINQAMIEQALDWLKLEKQHQVLDLFCGVGNFTLPIAQHCQNIIGIEGLKELVDTANNNAQLNQLENCQFHKANLFDDNRKSAWFRNQKYQRVLLDPGRQGAFEICKQLHLLKADIIVYVSCNSATLIRDLKELQKHGYQLRKARLLDMFPHTTHSEVMVQLVKTKKTGKPNKKVFRL